MMEARQSVAAKEQPRCDEVAPFVTVIMPVRNESAYIDRSMRCVLEQLYPPERLQVLVVDGMSEDDTRLAVQRAVADAQEDARPVPSSVRLLDNPGRIAPVALNLGLRRAEGSVIIRVDGHCQIPQDYVRRCVDVLARTGADCVGGQMTAVGEGWVARAISAAQSSFFGAGGAAFRTGRKSGRYVDTVAFGAYRREVFERLGGFDEELVRNQDDEFNFRLVQSGGKIWLDPSIRSVYYSRASLASLWKQYFGYGLYKVRLIQKRKAVPSWRHLVPAGFVLCMGAAAGAAVLTGRWTVAAVPAAAYAAASLLASLWSARRDWSVIPLLPAAFAIMHVAYGVGFLSGLWRWRRQFARGGNPVNA